MSLDQRRGALEEIARSLVQQSEAIDGRLSSLTNLMADRLGAAEQQIAAVTEALSQKTEEAARMAISQFETMREAAMAEGRKAVQDAVSARTELEAELHRATSDADQSARAASERLVQEIAAAVTEASSRFTETSEQMRKAAQEMRQDLDRTRQELQRGVTEMPQEALTATSGMREAITEQIAAINELSSLVAKHSGQGAPVPPPAAARQAQPAPAPQPAASRPAPPQPAPSQALTPPQSAAPLQPSAPAPARQSDAAGNGTPIRRRESPGPRTGSRFGMRPPDRHPDALPRRRRPPAPNRRPGSATRLSPVRAVPRNRAKENPVTTAPAADGLPIFCAGPPRTKRSLTGRCVGVKRPRHLPSRKANPLTADRPGRSAADALHSLSVDIARAVDHEASMELWDRYRRGERNVFTRRLYTLQGQKTFDEIRRKYQRDPDFRGAVNHYVDDFERLLAQVSRNDRDPRMAQKYLTSDTGKVYTMLAHAAGRLG